MNEQFDSLINSFGQLQKIVENLDELAKKKDNIELINDILDAREKREIKPEVRTVVTDDVYQSLKKRIRKEIVEECEYRILNYLFNAKLKYHAEAIVENVMRIIRDE